jgi:uncharacterized protein (TIGR03435 family)
MAGVVRAQTVAPAFEVASIKPSGPKSVRGSDGGPGRSDPGTFRYGEASLLDLIEMAYKVDAFQVSSRIALDRQTFDLVAKVSEGATRQQFRAMLQNFLAERFHLKLHIESKEFPAYELVVLKTGLKLREGVAAPRTPPDQGWPVLPPNQPGISANMGTESGVEVVRLKAQQEPLSALAVLLRNPEEIPVVDKTGLTGKYDFNLEYSREVSGLSPEGPAPLPDVFQALDKQLGLQLVRKKVPFDVLMIESVDQTPTEN